MQQRLFRAQMNPHFTSNILQSIQNINKENPQKATNYLVKFSRLLRIVLENSTQNYIPIEKEIEVLSKYLDLQQLQYSNVFNYQINNNIEDDSGIKIPPMLIQPFVENAIKHGFYNIKYTGNITITLNKTDKYIHCTIDDNGNGAKLSLDKNSTSSTKLIDKLLRKLTKKSFSHKIKQTPNTGTIIDIDIPYIIDFN